MTIPTTSPTTTAQEIQIQLSSCKSHRIKNVAATISTELRFVPKANEPSKSFMVAFSLVRTANIPIIERIMPTAAINIGAITALNCITVSAEWIKAAAPSAAVARIEPQ